MNVVEIEKAALDWIDRHFHLFNPMLHASPRRAVFVIKAAAELAMVCAAATTNAHGREMRYRQVAERLWLEVFSVDAVQSYMFSNIAAVPLTGFYASMRQCGFDDERCRDRIIRTLRSGFLSAVERTPASELDFRRSLHQGNFASPDLAQVYRRSLLAHHPNLYPLADDDVYAFTHTIFFTTDFSRSEPDFFTDDDRLYFATAFPRLIDYYLRKQDWDLSAELLITLRCVGLDTCRSFAAGWSCLSKTQSESGSYPGPVGKDDRERETAVEPEWADFRDDYHTTLAVLLALLVAPPRVPDCSAGSV